MDDDCTFAKESIVNTFHHIFPEFKESKDEMIRKEIINYFTEGREFLSLCSFDRERILAWLEKQGEQKFADKIEPKFKVGDWVVFNNKHQSIYQVEKIEDGYYILRHTHGGTLRVCVLHDESLRFWAIQDAKDGDVLVASDGSIFLFKGTIDCACKHYVALTTDDVVKFNEGLEHYWETSTAVHPATKEQRDTLIKAIADAGYEWDAEKKELKKIEQEPAWSEEDERNLKGVIDEIEANKNGVLSWLKSLRPPEHLEAE